MLYFFWGMSAVALRGTTPSLETSTWWFASDGPGTETPANGGSECGR